MTFTIQLTPQGKDVLHGVLPHMERKFRGGIRAALFQVGFNLVKTARDGIQRQSKKGRVYKRRGKRARRASAGGQYPGIVTGQTIAAIDYDVRGADQLEFGIRDRNDRKPKNLPTFLEEGTRRMAARPTLGLSNAAREKDIYNWLRRMPLQRMTQK